MSSPENKYLIPLAIVVAGVLVAGAIYFGAGNTSGQNTVATAKDNSTKIDISPVEKNDHIRGDKNAEIVIVEYSDLECPFCKIFHGTMKSVVETYEGKVAWVYRHFPIEQLHRRAKKEAEASECAAELGGNSSFWNYIDLLLETSNSNDSLDPAELPKIAQKIGLDVTAFNTCLDSGRYTDFIEESVSKAIKAGAQGTPYSIILSKSGETRIINGAEPLSAVRRKIDELLK